MGKSHSTWCSNSAQSSTYYHGSMRVRPGRFQPTPPDAIFQLPAWRNNASKLHGLSLWENHIRPGTRIPRKVQLITTEGCVSGQDASNRLHQTPYFNFRSGGITLQSCTACAYGKSHIRPGTRIPRKVQLITTEACVSGQDAKGSRMLLRRGYQMVEKVFRYVQSF